MNPKFANLISITIALFFGCSPSKVQKNSIRIPFGTEFPELFKVCETREGEKGPKPEQEVVSGLVPMVKAFMDTTLVHPKSIKFSGWSELIEKDKCWAVRSEYSALNGANLETSYNTVFVIKENKIIQNTEFPVLESK